MPEQRFIDKADRSMLRFRLRVEAGRYPRLYDILERHFGRSTQTLVGPGTHVCIEAPPGCGNSFLTHGFELANPAASIASHHHVPAQVLNALRRGIPTLTILRNPIDSTLSRVSFGRGEDEGFIGPNLRCWILFWKGIEGVLDKVPIVSFENLTTNPSNAIRTLNTFHNTAFVETFPETETVFAAMDRRRRLKIGDRASANPNPNRPDEAKAEKQASLRGLVERHRSAARAEGMYVELRGRLTT